MTIERRSLTFAHDVGERPPRFSWLSDATVDWLRGHLALVDAVRGRYVTVAMRHKAGR